MKKYGHEHFKITSSNSGKITTTFEETMVRQYSTYIDKMPGNINHQLNFTQMTELDYEIYFTGPEVHYLPIM